MFVSSMEYIFEGEILVIIYGWFIVFYSVVSLDLIKFFEVFVIINFVFFYFEKEFFVVGGEDFKFYKYDYNSGEELEFYKGYFGFIYCVRFSFDGEFYVSGLEDGILRLW